MGEERADIYPLQRVAKERIELQEVRDAGFQPHAAGGDQPQHRRRGEELGDRGDVEDRGRGHGDGPFPGSNGAAPGLLMQHFAVPLYPEHGAGKETLPREPATILPKMAGLPGPFSLFHAAFVSCELFIAILNIFHKFSDRS